MINITKQGNNVIVTSDNPNSFHIGNGELSVPLNTIYYVLDDESDFIQFNSTEKGKILFNGTIGDIQVNGNIVNRENILMELDNVFNSAAIGGEGGTAGVLAINGYDGYINLKSINGQSLIGSGNIEIEGGEGGTAGVNKIIMGDEDYGWNALQGDIKLTNGWMDLDDDGKPETYDIRVGNNESSSLWFGFNSTDNSIKIEDNGSRLNFTVNPDILGGGGSATEFTEWKNGNSIALGNGAFSDEMGIAIGSTAESTGQSVAIGRNAKNTDYDQVAIGYGIKNDDEFYTNINNVIKGDVNKYAFIKNEYGNYVRIPTEWTGTQSEYDALGTYYDNITYNIIEG